MTDELKDRRLHQRRHGIVVSTNLSWNETKVTPEERMAVVHQDAATIWLTGYSGSGKSTIAYELEKVLIQNGHIAYTLDGDNIRQGLNEDLGFAPHDRTENIRRIAEVCKLFNQAGVFVVTAFISPYRSDRQMARDVIGADKFIETHLATSIDVCEKRDPKGLYKKARAGQIGEFTGITAPYEPPLTPEMTIDTSTKTVPECVQAILDKIAPRFYKG